MRHLFANLRWSIVFMLLVGGAVLPKLTFAISSGGENARSLPDDDAFRLGREAFEKEDWPSVISHMKVVVEQKPWLDEAYNLLGFAHRKLGDYDRSLALYDRALTLNPHNRGALEYLGEAYLELDRPDNAAEILSRLAVECERVAASFEGGDWRAGCDEWAELEAAYRAHIDGRPPPEHD